MKKSKAFAFLLTGAIAFSVFGGVAFAVPEEQSNGIVTIEADLSTDDYQEKVIDLLEDPDILEVNVVDPNLVNASVEENNPGIEPNKITSYKVYGSKYVGSYTGSTVLARAKGGPGTELSISETKSVSNTYSCSVSVSSKKITAEVGFDVSKSESITVSGSAKVPKKHNNKSVKTMTLTAYPLYDKYSYSISKTVNENGISHTDKNYGSGTASKAIGCTFKKTYTYK